MEKRIELTVKIMNKKFSYNSYGNFLKGKGLIFKEILKMIDNGETENEIIDKLKKEYKMK